MILLAVAGFTALLCIIIRIWLTQCPPKHAAGRNCNGSRAQFTCDPGTPILGYNNVVAIVKYASVVPRSRFISHFCSQMSTTDVLRRCWEEVQGRMQSKCMGGDWDMKSNFSFISRCDSVDISSIASKFLSEPLRLDQPGWEVRFIDSVHPIEGGSPFSVAMIKYHHSMADGFTMVQKLGLQIRPVDPNIRLEDVFPSFRNPKPDDRKGWLKQLIGTVRELGSMAVMSADRPGLFRASTARRLDESLNVSLSSSIRVDRIKQLCHSLSDKYRLKSRLTINDMITTLLARSFRAYTVHQGFEPRDLTSVVWVTLNQKPLDANSPWNNSGLGFAYTQIPVACKSPQECIMTCHQRLNELKSSAQPLIINKALWALGSVPLWMGKKIAAQMADYASVSLSNLVGPKVPVNWPSPSDAHVDAIYFATSPPFRFGPLVSVISYSGTFYFSISARASLLSQKSLDWILNEGLQEALVELESLM